MAPVMQSIKNLGLFLFGIVMIVAGHKANDAQAQAKAGAEKMKAPEVPEKEVASEMPSKAMMEMPAKAKAPKQPVKAKTVEVLEKPKAPETAEHAHDVVKAAPKKPITILEKAKPEKAHASKAKASAEPKTEVKPDSKK